MKAEVALLFQYKIIQINQYVLTYITKDLGCVQGSCELGVVSWKWKRICVALGKKHYFGKWLFQLQGAENLETLIAPMKLNIQQLANPC